MRFSLFCVKKLLKKQQLMLPNFAMLAATPSIEEIATANGTLSFSFLLKYVMVFTECCQV